MRHLLTKQFLNSWRKKWKKSATNWRIQRSLGDDKVIALRWSGKQLATNWRAWDLGDKCLQIVTGLLNIL